MPCRSSITEDQQKSQRAYAPGRVKSPANALAGSLPERANRADDQRAHKPLDGRIILPLAHSRAAATSPDLSASTAQFPSKSAPHLTPAADLPGTAGRWAPLDSECQRAQPARRPADPRRTNGDGRLDFNSDPGTGEGWLDINSDPRTGEGATGLQQ